MTISKVRLHYEAPFIFLWLFILSLPISLLYKVELLGLEFSISYFLLIFFVIFAFINYFFFLKKDFKFFTNIVIFTFIFSYILLFFNSLFIGIDIKFLIFFLTFILNVIIGYLYRDLILNYFTTEFLILTYVLVFIGLIIYYYNIPLFDFNITNSDLYFTNSDGQYRLMSIFMNPNSFAYYLLLFFSIYIYSNKTILNSFLFLIIVYVLFLTESRSALLGLLLILLIYSYKIFKQNKQLTILTICSIGLIFLTIFLLSTNPILINYDIRFEKISIAIEYIGSSIFFFLTGIPKDIAIIKNNISFSDNMFLYMFLKMGLFSFSFFLFGYIYTLIKAIRILNLTNNIAIKPYAIFFISTLFPMFFSNLLLFSPVYILIALSIGVIIKGDSI